MGPEGLLKKSNDPRRILVFASLGQGHTARCLDEFRKELGNTFFKREKTQGAWWKGCSRGGGHRAGNQQGVSLRNPRTCSGRLAHLRRVVFRVSLWPLNGKTGSISPLTLLLAAYFQFF